MPWLMQILRKTAQGDDFLNRERAKQIMESRGVIQVLHNGSPVWIESIKGDNAEVTYIESKKRAEVPLNTLNETHPM